MPVCTSSRISSTPCLSHASRKPRRHWSGTGRTPPSPWIGSMSTAAQFARDGLIERVMVAEGEVLKPWRRRAKTLQIGRVAAGSDGGQRSPVKGAFKGDDVHPFGLTLIIVVAPRGLDRAFQRLGAGIGEEHLVGKGRIAQPLGELFAQPSI
jgi:hypothetical protein